MMTNAQVQGQQSLKYVCMKILALKIVIIQHTYRF